MKRFAACLLLAAAALLPFAAGVTSLWACPEPQFGRVDLFVDAPQPLAAWQIDVRAPVGTFQLVGVEGGDGVYHQPAHYDPAALQKEHVVVAAFSTANPGSLPQGRVRVAQLNVWLPQGRHPEYAITLIAAATVGGARIAATVTHEPGFPR